MAALAAMLLLSSAASADGPVLLSGVLRDRDGFPLAGVTVGLNPVPSGTPTSSVTGADGRYSLTMAPGSYRLVLSRSGGPSSMPFNVFGPSFDLTADRVQDLTLRVVFATVRVLDTAGLPVSGARVAMSQTDALNVEPFPGYVMSSGFLASQAITDASGEARVPWLPTNATPFGSSASVSPTSSSPPFPTTNFTIATITSDTTIVVTLPAAVSLSGIVRDRAGSPLAGVMVGLTPVPTGSQVSVVSGTDGRYSLSVAPGTYRLVLGRSGVTAILPSFNVQGPSFSLTSDRVQDITLPNVVVTVRVLDAAGTPMPGARVQASQSGSLNIEPFPGYVITDGFENSQANTDASGEAKVPWLPSNATLLGSSATVNPGPGSPLFPPVNFSLGTITASTTIVVTLPSFLSLTGVVRDLHGLPLAGVGVTLAPVPGGTGVGVSSGSDGRYSINASPGMYRLGLSGSTATTSLPSFNIFGPSFSLTADRVQDLTLANVVITVRVLDTAGIPVPGARVSASQTDSLNVEPFPGYVIAGGFESAQGITGASGEARLPWLPSTAGFFTSASVSPNSPSSPQFPTTNFSLGSITTDTTITVNVPLRLDTVAPALQLPSNQTAEAVSPAGAAVSYTASATDAFDPHPAVTCLPASGSTFPLGTTPVNCTARDFSGNSSSGSFNVTVRDTTAPALTVPAAVTVNATGPNGALVWFSVAATDLVDLNPTVACSPTSGAGFAIGDTTVTCTATDAARNQSTARFVVHVRGAAEQLADLAAAVAAVGPGGSLAAQIEAARAALASGRPALASALLAAFASEVAAQAGKSIPAATASAWIDAATRIRAFLA